MATVVHDRPQYERRRHERRSNWTGALVRTQGMKVSWGGIWGGVLVALGLLMLLTALGLAIGVSAVDPGQTDPSTVGTGAGIWGSISLLVALFVGGMVATRIGAITDKTTGFFEGSLVWVVSLLIMAYFASSGIGMLASGAFQLVGGATQALGTAVQTQAGSGGVNLSGTVDEVAQRLRDPQTAQQISQISGLPANEVRSTLEQTAQRVEANRDNPSQALQEAQQGLGSLMDRARDSGALEQRAEEVQPEASAAAWITFGALVLSLLAAVIGAMVGRSRVVAAATEPVTT
jgi:hypothetical protein